VDTVYMILDAPEWLPDNQGHYASCHKKWHLAATDMYPCGKHQTMSHGCIVIV